MTSSHSRTMEKMERNAIEAAAQKSAQLTLLNFQHEEAQIGEKQKAKENRSHESKIDASSRTTSSLLPFRADPPGSYANRYEVLEQNHPPIELQENDVICGSNPKSASHSGNIKFSYLIKTFHRASQEKLCVYYGGSFVSGWSLNDDQPLKHRIVQCIFQDTHSRGGRFLVLVENNSNFKWQELEEAGALANIVRAMHNEAKFCIKQRIERALRNYETFYSLKPGSAKIITVKQSSAGVSGWADSNITLPCSTPSFDQKDWPEKKSTSKKKSKRRRWDTTEKTAPPPPKHQKQKLSPKNSASEATKLIPEEDDVLDVVTDGIAKIELQDCIPYPDERVSCKHVAEINTERQSSRHEKHHVENMSNKDGDKLELPKEMQNTNDNSEAKDIISNQDQCLNKTNGADILIEGFVAILHHHQHFVDNDDTSKEWTLVEALEEV